MNKLTGRNPINADPVLILQDGEPLEVRRISLIELLTYKDRFPFLADQINGKQVDPDSIPAAELSAQCDLVVALALTEKNAPRAEVEATVAQLPEFFTPTELDAAYGIILTKSVKGVTEAMNDPDFLAKTSGSKAAPVAVKSRKPAAKPR